MKLLPLSTSILLLATLAAADERWKNRGARKSFVEVEAEHAHHNGRVIGNSRTYSRELSSEASGRRAVQLTAVGQFVEFTLPIRANSIVLRTSIPDSSDGHGLDATLDVFVDGHKQPHPLAVTSRYSWFYGSYPFNNNPNEKLPHHFFDEGSRMLFDKTYNPGSKVKVVVTSTSVAHTFTIDLADFELVSPPLARPGNSLSVTDFGADPNGHRDSREAFQKAVDAGKGQHKTVFIPPGHYLLYDHVIVDQVSLVGAGPWYSVLGGRHPNDRRKSAGIFGKYEADHQGASSHVHLANFAIIGDITERDDTSPTTALGGSLSNSLVENLWLQHVKCGAWFDGRMSNFTMRHTRIVDTTADGVNFHKGVTQSTVENCFLRNTGDDGLAMWADSIPEVGNRFVHNTVGLPVLANNIAIYGGHEIEVSDNLVYDTVTNGGGIHIANRFTNVKGESGVKGNIKVYRNTLLRAGASDTNWQFGVGALWFNGINEEIHANIHVLDCDIIDSSYAAVAFIEGKVFGVELENVHINGTGTFVLQIQGGGDVKFRNVRADNVQQAGNPIFNCNMPFTVHVEGANPWYHQQQKAVCSEIKQYHPNYPWQW